jgi:hypothetical protein
LYAARGSLLGIHGINPYYSPPSILDGNPLLSMVYPGWLDRTQPYGPLWSVFSGEIMRLGSFAPSAAVLRYQLAGFLGSLLCLFCLFRLLDCQPEGERRTNLLLYALNPLLLLEFVNNAHNDVWLSVFGLAALLGARRMNPVLTLPLLTMAALIKYAYLVVIPAAILALYRQMNRRVFIESLLISAAAVFFVVGPFYENAGFFNGLLQVSGLDPLYSAFFGLPVVTAGLLQEFAGAAILSFEAALWIGRGLFVVTAIWILRYSRLRLALQAEFLLTGLAVLFSAVLLPWYLTWWIPLCALNGAPRRCFFWTAVGMFSYSLSYRTALSLLIGLSLIGAVSAIMRYFKKDRPVKSMGSSPLFGQSDSLPLDPRTGPALPHNHHSTEERTRFPLKVGRR